MTFPRTFCSIWHSLVKNRNRSNQNNLTQYAQSLESPDQEKSLKILLSKSQKGRDIWAEIQVLIGTKSKIRIFTLWNLFKLIVSSTWCLRPSMQRRRRKKSEKKTHFNKDSLLTETNFTKHFETHTISSLLKWEEQSNLKKAWSILL